MRLSFGQERLWFLGQLEPESSAYNEGRSVSLTGDVDVGALEEALRQIVRRHQGLRTTFLCEDGIPLQTVSDEREFTLEVIDLRSLPDAEGAMRARDHVRETLRRPFDLSRDLLLRARLLRLRDQEYILTLVTHQSPRMVGPPVSAQELEAFYEAAVFMRPAEIADLPIQYADYAVWQREWLSGAVLNAARLLETPARRCCTPEHSCRLSPSRNPEPRGSDAGGQTSLKR